MKSPWQFVVGQLGSTRRPRELARRAHAAWAEIERLEGRQLLTLTVTPINVVEGSAFQGQIATFQGGEVTGSNLGDLSATINWGDGSALTAGTIINSSPTPFAVTGSHTYAVAGSYTVSVVLRGTSLSSVSAQGSATVSQAPILVTATGIQATAGVPFDGQVATFTDAGPGTPGQYTATITWESGSTSTGKIVAGPNSNSFVVTGTHTYATAGSKTYTVTVDQSGTAGQATGTATVARSTPVATAGTIAPEAGVPFEGIVATFTDTGTGPTKSSYIASIDWGDNTPATAGTIEDVAGGGYSVTGTHTYNKGGSFTTTVTVFRVVDNVQSVDSGTAVVSSAAPIDALSINPATTLNSVAGQSFTADLGTILDSNPGARPADYSVVVDWGDGTTSSTATGGVKVQFAAAPATGQAFTILGTHTYAQPGFATLRISVNRIYGGQTAAATLTNSVAASAPFTGRLDPLSDTGASNSDGITRINQPTFSGTVQQYALVQIYSQLAGQLGPILLGSTIAGENGTWSLSTGPLADGTYTVTAVVTAPGTGAVTTTALPTLVIDTVAPRVTGLIYARNQGQVQVLYSDDASGINPGSIARAVNYRLTGRGRRGSAATGQPAVIRAGLAANDPRSAVVTLNKAAVKAGLRTFVVVSGGVTDVAGNPLDGVFHGKFPSGNGRPGSNFVAPLAKARKGVVAEQAAMPAAIRAGAAFRRGR